MAQASGDRVTSAARRRWLAVSARAGGWQIRGAAALLLLDGAAAIGFAGGLAGALGTLPDGAAAAPWLALGLTAAVSRGACAWGGARLGAAGSALARGSLRRRAMVACLGQPPGAARPAADMVAVAVDAVEQMDGYFSRFLPAQRAAGAVSLLVLLAAACSSPVSAAIMATTLVPFTALMILAGGAAADHSRRQFDALSRLSSMFADRVRALPVILCCGAADAQANRLAEAADALRRRTMAVLKVAFISSAGLEFFAALSVALVAVYAGFDLLGLLPFPAPEHLSLARAFFVLALAPEFYAPMRRVAAAYHDRQAAETAADQLMALEGLALASLPPHTALTAPPAIRFVAATVRFPGDDRPALDRLSFLARPSEIVALLGPSGAGKTTALNLLLGLAPLTGGEVLVDGVALREAGAWTRSIAWMGQDPVIMPGSIAENVALSRRNATAPEIAAAAGRVGLCTLLGRRPGGLNAPLNERGTGLSGGERRRIALARALLKQAPILLLDEPTAHLDAAAERALIEAIRRAAEGRTTIIATHSAALARIAHRVVRVGEVEGTG
jgi:ATP-binding cassette subfamily C protein CydD